MQWFPKRFAPGDIHGQGAEKLLGRPDLEKMEVLVRETAQNSWDARGTSAQIEFCINLRRLSESNLATLRNNVFRENGGNLGLEELLARDEVWALEISDRGTIGLGGPTRNDLVPDLNQPTNFIDFVFDLGAPKSQDMTGGTYGYGKTISYSSSSVGTVLIWSRCDTDGGVEDRLIGSAIGPSFNLNDRRYTGRHWWGRSTSDGERIDPLVGANAANTANRVFAREFEESSTGTSLLILNPEFGEDLGSRRDQAVMLAGVVQNHLWPKFVSSEFLESRMDITVQLDGEDIEIGDTDSNRILANYANCLNTVRRVQNGGSTDDGSMVQTIPIKRYNDVVGHLSLARFPMDPHAEINPDSDETEPRKLQANRVALMRNQAELVVKYLQFPALPVEGFAWVGVFKPVSSTDHAFAASEPPAHDEWNPATITDKRDKSIVNVALRRIKESVSSYLAPAKQKTEDFAQPPAARVGDFLSGLLVGLEGPAPARRQSSTKPRSPQTKRAKANIVDVRTDPMPDSGWNTSIVTVQMSADDGRAHKVSMDLAIGVEGNARDSGDEIVLKNFGWLDDTGTIAEESILLSGGETAFFVFDSSAKVAIDLQANVVGS